MSRLCLVASVIAAVFHPPISVQFEVRVFPHWQNPLLHAAQVADSTKASNKTVLLLSLPATGTLQPECHPHHLLPSKRLGSSILIDGHSEGPLMAKTYRRARRKQSRQSQVVDVLPDDVLLAIFDFFVNQHLAEDLSLHDKPTKKEIEVWQALVHVCRQWRSVVFGSPRRLNLRLACTAKTPARDDMLDVWPALPLLIRGKGYSRKGVDNIIPVLERRDRVCQIDLGIPASQWRKVTDAMEEPFPELTRLGLRLDKHREMVVVLPDSFLGGCAPQLRFLSLEGFQLPGSPKLLLSASHLSILHLGKIPHPGYISPEEVVTTLSMLTSLEFFSLEFASPGRHHGQAIHPPICSVLPVLTSLRFKGPSEYLEDLVARIDSPRLFGLDITVYRH